MMFDSMFRGVVAAGQHGMDAVAMSAFGKIGARVLVLPVKCPVTGVTTGRELREQVHGHLVLFCEVKAECVSLVRCLSLRH